MSLHIAAGGMLWGRGLRYFLVSALANAGRPLSVAELIALVDAAPAKLSGRASKRISDALRWEVELGRVRRVGRAMYEYAGMPRSTRWFVERRVYEMRQVLSRHAAGDPVTLEWSQPPPVSRWRLPEPTSDVAT